MGSGSGFAGALGAYVPGPIPGVPGEGLAGEFSPERYNLAPGAGVPTWPGILEYLRDLAANRAGIEAALSAWASLFVPFFYGVTGTALGVGGVAQANLTTGGDAYFLISRVQFHAQIVATGASPRVLVQVTDAASGSQWGNVAIPIEAYTVTSGNLAAARDGSPQRDLVRERILRPSTTLRFDYTDRTSAAASVVDVVLHGYKFQHRGVAF
jgi:hypothetical protein